jgi:hypothetical protein
MRWEDTIASGCRYGDVLAPLFEGGDVIWEFSTANYQGFANVLVAMPDGRFIHYEWTYGSCSGCDEWENRGLSDEQICEEAIKVMAVLKTRDILKRYLKLEGEFEDANVPSANTPTNGSLPGMLRYLGNGASSDFLVMGEAVKIWLAENNQ